MACAILWWRKAVERGEADAQESIDAAIIVAEIQQFAAASPTAVYYAPDQEHPRVHGLEEGEFVSVMGTVRGLDWYVVQSGGELLGFIPAADLAR